MDRRSVPVVLACVVAAGALWSLAGGCGDDEAGPAPAPDVPTPAVPATPSHPSPTPRGEYEPSMPESRAIAGAQAAAMKDARADPDDAFDEDAAASMHVDGYVVEIREPGLHIAVLVDPDTAQVTPIAQTSLAQVYGWLPAGTLTQIDRQPAGDAERWAVDSAQTVVMSWLDGVPGFGDGTLRHEGVVRYSVSPAGDKDRLYLVTPAGVVIGGSGP